MKKKFTVIGIVGMSLVIAGCGNAKNVATQTNPAPQVKTAAKQSLIYVPNAGDGTVSVIDPNVNKVVDTISLGTKQASHGIALSLDGKTLYTGTGFDGKSLIVIDTKTKKKINEIKFDEGVHGIDLSPDGKFLYISLNPGLGQEGNGGIAIIKTDTMETIAEVQTDKGPAHVAVTPDGSQVWVANVNADTVSVIDTKTNSLVKTIKVGDVPNEVAISPDGKWAFAANVESDLVSVIDTTSLQVVRTVQAGDGPHGVTVSPNGKELWVANNNSNDVTVIDTATLDRKVSIPTGSYANHIAFSLDGKWAYVTNKQSNDVVKIDVDKKEIVAKIPVGIDPHEISLEDYVSTTFEKINYTFTSSTAKSNEGVTDIKQRIKSARTDSVMMDVLRLAPSDPVTGTEKVDFDKYDGYQISLTTHFGDLSSLPLDQNTYLITKNGKKVKPINWIVQSNDAHHPLYLVIFPKTDTGKVTLEVGKLTDEPIQLTWE
ncbi:beta-propeller fold lactonase family protein [Schinkia sp. CFF1]